jgi:hypothetical protein
MMDSGWVCEEHPWPAVGRPFTLVPVALLGTCRNGPIRRFELGHSFRLGRDRLRDLRDGIGAGLGHAIRLAVDSHSELFGRTALLPQTVTAESRDRVKLAHIVLLSV